MTTKERILAALDAAGVGLACHQINLIGVSQNSLATRLSELQKAGKVRGSFDGGKPYKTWRIMSPQMELI
jgi:DNA-binding transcriptional ArsR family regulator